jgi:hypothetical protein
MKVITRNPILYSNAEGDGDKIAAVTAGVTALAGLGAALASRGRKPLSEIETKCGKKPLLGFTKKGKAWAECSQKMSTANTQQAPLDVQPKKKNTILYIGIGVGVLALVGLVIYLKRGNGQAQ